MQPKLWTVNALSIELERDRRSLARDLAGLRPDETRTQGTRTLRAWRMARVIRHLYQHQHETGALDANHERARKDKEMADKLELENRVRRRELIPEEEVIDSVGGVIADANARLIQLPHIIEQVCPPGVAVAVAGFVRKYVFEIIEDLRRGAAPHMSKGGAKKRLNRRAGNGHAQN